MIEPTAGVLEDDVRIGDEWVWGTARLQVCQPRAPCFKLALHLGRPDANARLSAEGRTGWYLRVLVPGEVWVAPDADSKATMDAARKAAKDAEGAAATEENA